jgi:hypothetical protein
MARDSEYFNNQHWKSTDAGPIIKKQPSVENSTVGNAVKGGTHEKNPTDINPIIPIISPGFTTNQLD